jgi:hypothetical protein
MRGTHKISIRSKRLRYDFEIRRNITIIQGNSATGKTSLVDMIREVSENGIESGIELICDKNCTVINGINWQKQLDIISDSIVFIDEGNNFVSSNDFASYIKNTDNYYVIITRESLHSLPYSVKEIYGIKNSGKYNYLKQTYHEFYNIYPEEKFEQPIDPKAIITEDSNSGYDFFNNICMNYNISCESAKGKSNIFSLLEKTNKDYLIIADGAAFGSEIDRITKIIKNKNIKLFLPESFEWLILISKIIEDSKLNNILSNTSNYIESKDFFSWERFFNDYLVKITANTKYSYSKNKLNPIYLESKIITKILEKIKGIKFRG